MKDYVRILEKNKKSSFQRVFTVRGEEQSKLQWNALNLMEEAFEDMKARLTDILDPDIESRVSNVKLDIFNELGGEPRLLVKAQLYDSNSRELLLKVFVHEMQGKGKTRKLARAIYTLQLFNTQSGRKVA